MTMLQVARSTAAPPRRRRHCYSAWPHQQPSARDRVCRACCEELAAEFGADEMLLVDEIIEDRNREPEITTSNELPF